jgi:hypothetical protein
MISESIQIGWGWPVRRCSGVIQPFTWLAFNVYSGKRDNPIPAGDRNQMAFCILSVLLQRKSLSGRTVTPR